MELILLLVTTCSYAILVPLVILSLHEARESSQHIERIGGGVSMILEAQIDSEEWDVHHLLADSDVALNTDMVNRPILKTWF